MAQDTSLHYTIYLDRLLAEYFLTYLLLLLIAGMLTERKILWKRIAVCALIWSCMGIACLFLPVMLRAGGSFCVNIAAGMLMFHVLYGRVHGKLVSAVFSLGVAVSVMYLTGCFHLAYRLEKITGIRGGRLLIAILLTLVLGVWIGGRRGQTLYHVKFFYQGKDYEVTALLDTGNGLTDPVSKKAVCVLEEESILCEFREMNEGIYMIPYHTIGKDSGVLPAVKVHQVTIRDKKNIYLCREMLLAVYHGKFSKHGKYQMLLHSDYLKERNRVC